MNRLQTIALGSLALIMAISFHAAADTNIRVERITAKELAQALGSFGIEASEDGDGVIATRAFAVNCTSDKFLKNATCDVRTGISFEAEAIVSSDQFALDLMRAFVRAGAKLHYDGSGLNIAVSNVDATWEFVEFVDLNR